jgi:hypothetical protein
MPTVLPRGITLLDLILRVPPAATELVPDAIAGFLQLFSIYGLTITSQGLAPLISRLIEDPSGASPWRFEL